MGEVAALRRHDLVYVKPDAWLDLLAGQDFGALDPDVLTWAALARPTIFRRRICSDASDAVPLGLPLPPGMGRRRLALACPASALARTAPPPSLRETLPVAPNTWRPTIEALLAEGISWRCFGSLAWQYLTGLSYLTNASDLDLLVRCASDAEAARATAVLSDVAARAPMRIDAELVSPLGAAVQWREWSSRATELLAKSQTGPAIVAREALFP